jgi:alpha-tubulin suppressor-like RCC1 family protein
MDSVDAGAGHTCALDEDGRAWCWGQNDEGQAGDGTVIPRDRAVPVVGSFTFRTISAGHAHSCAVRTDGVAFCWGDDSRGQLGNGGTGNARSSVPVQVLLNEPIAMIDAGYYQTCAVTRSGGAWCWGANDAGQLGDGSTADAYFPVRVTNIDNVTHIGAGDRFVCALRAGATWCWGDNSTGIMGTLPGATSALPVRVQAPALASLSAAIGASTIASSARYACALRTDGQPVCWGGATRALRTASPAPLPLPSPSRLRLITTGAQHVCALDPAGEAWCGGANYAGQLGNDGFTDRDRLTLVASTRPPQ